MLVPFSHLPSSKCDVGFSCFSTSCRSLSCIPKYFHCIQTFSSDQMCSSQNDSSDLACLFPFLSLHFWFPLHRELNGPTVFLLFISVKVELTPYLYLERALYSKLLSTFLFSNSLCQIVMLSRSLYNKILQAHTNCP